MNVVGVTMIAATLITPAVTARLMTDCFSRMLIYSLIIGAMTGVGGMYLSYAFNTASGATIVLFGAALFCLTWLTRFIHGRRIAHGYLNRGHHSGQTTRPRGGMEQNETRI
jgi:manganese/iron transport system permease protein/iron/zinc/copper transport system permease protein